MGRQVLSTEVTKYRTVVSFLAGEKPGVFILLRPSIRYESRWQLSATTLPQPKLTNDLYYVGPLLTSPEAGEARSGRSTESVLRPVSTHHTTVPATVRSTSHAGIRPLSVHQKLRIVSATA